MPFILSERNSDLTEWMDRPDCDPVLLENTYRQFATINRILSQWKKIYRNEIRPHLTKTKPATLLDIGFGGGDIPYKLLEWAREDGFELQITAVETDPRAFRFAKQHRNNDNIEYLHCSSTDLLDQGKHFDFVISNHLIHHLDARSLPAFLDEATRLATCKVIFNDIERSDAGYALFNLFSGLIFRKSFIRRDGLLSIRRSYIADELRAQVPGKWNVQRIFPFRLVLCYEAG